jgi:hypothetical protein
MVLEMRAPHGGGTGVKNDTTDVGVVTVDDTAVLTPNTKKISAGTMVARHRFLD